MTLNDKSQIDTTNPIFLETGTFHGRGVYNALEQGYEKVISIEIFEPLYNENLERFSEQIQSGKVELILGDSGKIIGDVVKSLTEPITFWFDAHDQTMNDAGVGDVKCPIVHELKSIIANRSQSARDNDILLIDDMRLIEDPRVGWAIDMTEFYKTIWAYNMDFSLRRISGYTPHDIILAKKY